MRASKLLLLSRPGWAARWADADLDFVNGRYFGASLSTLLSGVRNSPETSLLPTASSGASYLTFGNNQLPIVPGVGLQNYIGRKNFLLNSTAPTTQTTESLATGTYTLWVNGSGSATPAGGTATITGAAAATNGSPNTFVVTVAGTVVATVVGSLNSFQLELGAFATPLIVTAGATASRSTDAVNLIGNALSIINGSTGTVVIETSGLADQTNPQLIFTTDTTRFLVYYHNHFPWNASTYNGSTLLEGPAISSISAINRVGIAWTPSSRIITADGETPSSDTNTIGAFDATTSLGGSASSSSNGIIRRLQFSKRNLSSAELISVTNGP